MLKNPWLTMEANYDTKVNEVSEESAFQYEQDFYY